MVANGDIDLAALRHFRQRPAMGNLLARQRFELYAPSYQNHHFYPANSFGEEIPAKSLFIETQKAVINKLTEQGVFEKE